MKKYAWMICCIALMMLFTTSFAFGQALDGLWFKAKIGIKGYTVDSGGNLSKMSGSRINYLHVVWGGSEYSTSVYDEVGNTISSSDTFVTIGANEDIISDLYLRLWASTDYVDTYQTSIVKIKRDSAGSIKSVTLTSMGCEAYQGVIDGKDFYGGCTVKAKKVDAPPFI